MQQQVLSEQDILHAGKKDELEAFLSGKDVFTLVLTAKGGGASHPVLLHIKIKPS